MNGQTVAVTGMGRSGIGVAKAAVRRGAKVTLYDEKLIESPEQIEQAEELQGLGVEVVAGWHGRFDAPDFDFLVSSPGFKRSHPALRDALEAGKPVWSEVEFAYQIARAPMVAITGTNGKSTTTLLTWLLIQSCQTAHLCGNLSGSGYPELTLTEAADIAEPTDWLVAEVSSFQLEWVHTFRPKAAAITNITPDHLDRHPNFEDYQNTKFRLFSSMGAGDCAVVNVFEPSLPLDLILPKIPSGVQVRRMGEVSAQKLELAGLGEVPVDNLPLFGYHNALNAVMAWELAMAALGDRAKPDAMLAALKSFRGLAHRMEYLGECGGVRVFNNSMCTNPAAVIANLEGQTCLNRVLMGGVTKDLNFQPLKEYLSSSPHQVYLFGPKLEGGLHEQLGGSWPAFRTLEEAFEAAMADAREGETVMLSPGCASAAPYANFRERGDAFRVYVQNWLKERQG